MEDVYGVEDVALSMPAIVGKDGVETLIPVRLSVDEQRKLKESAEILKGVIKDVL